MKQVKKDVKSEGKVVNTINVPQFETLEEAGKTLTVEKALEKINRQHMSDLMNEARAGATRTVTPAVALSRAAKQNPELEKKIAELMKQYNVATPAPAAAAEKK